MLTLFNHSLRIQPRDKAQKEGEGDEKAKNLVGRINSLMCVALPLSRPSRPV